MKLPLRQKTEAPASSETPTAAPGTPATSASSAAPRMPSQGHTQAKDQLNIPPPPAQVDGDYLVRFKAFKIWEDENGNPKTKDDGTLKAPTIFVIIDDPKQLALLNQGQENCYGAEVGYDVRLSGNWYQEAAAILAGFGAPRSAWPKDAKGNQTLPLLGQYLEQITKGKKFKATIKATEGKGENKGKVYTNLKKIVAAPIAAPPKPPTPAPAPQPEPDEDDEQPADQTTDGAEGSDG